MSFSATRRQQHLMPAAERKLSMAQRMPQLITARAFLFIVGGFCLCFGLVAVLLDKQDTDHLIDTEIELNASALAHPTDTMTRVTGLSQDNQTLYFIIAGFGALTVLTALRLYHMPLIGPIFTLILFAGTFVGFLRFNHSDNVVFYVIASFLILAAHILAIRAGHLFNQSYARMGRLHE